MKIDMKKKINQPSSTKLFVNSPEIYSSLKIKLKQNYICESYNNAQYFFLLFLFNNFFISSVKTAHVCALCLFHPLERSRDFMKFKKSHHVTTLDQMALPTQVAQV